MLFLYLQYFQQLFGQGRNSLIKNEIYWFDTWSVGDLLGYVEGVVIQEYFDKNKRLPIWNKAY